MLMFCGKPLQKNGLHFLFTFTRGLLPFLFVQTFQGPRGAGGMPGMPGTKGHMVRICFI